LEGADFLESLEEDLDEDFSVFLVVLAVALGLRGSGVLLAFLVLEALLDAGEVDLLGVLLMGVDSKDSRNFSEGTRLRLTLTIRLVG